MFTQELILVRISQRYYGADPRLVKNMDDDQNWSQYHTLHFTQCTYYYTISLANSQYSSVYVVATVHIRKYLSL